MGIRFAKYANLSPSGWSESALTQTVRVGDNAHIGLYLPESIKEQPHVFSLNPLVCMVHAEPKNPAYPGWCHLLLTGLQDGEAVISASLPSIGTVAFMTVKVVGKTGVRMVFFPGERRYKSGRVEGTIYVLGGHGESMVAAGGEMKKRPDRGGHTIEPTPPGHYVLGPRVHVTTPSWPLSVIAFGTPLRIRADGEVEFEASKGRWRVATGAEGAITKAQFAFDRRSGLNPKYADVIAHVRSVIIDSVTGTLFSDSWILNDFGRWGWNLRRNGQTTPFWIHTTAEDEMSHANHDGITLQNSHGCVHLVPAERDRLMKLGYLREGVQFEVRPYTEFGPPL